VRSDCTERQLLDHLFRHYGLFGRLTRIPRGRADNFLLSREETSWLFKVYQPGYTLARLERGARFVAFLVNAGYPTRAFVQTLEGGAGARIGARIAVLIPWISGDTPAPNRVSSPRVLRQFGSLCGRLHELAARYDQAGAFRYAGSLTTIVEKRDRLLLLQRSAGREIAREVDVRLAVLARWGNQLARSHARARRGLIHGDFSGQHVVLRNGAAVGVVDILGDMYLPGWELMRAFFQSVRVGNDSPDGLQRPAAAFLHGYGSQHTLAREEVADAYDAYLLQLAGSTYGLGQSDDAGLRAFGRWRTRLAEYLSEHREPLRTMLADLIPPAPRGRLAQASGDIAGAAFDAPIRVRSR
jgi:Ser/Thr protein kinase RdoA (MazF antagonist)